MTSSTPPRPKFLDWARWIALIAVLIFGAYVSLQYSRTLWTADPDIATPVVLWRGIQAHGWSFVATWRGSIDNWLFTLTPLAAALLTLAPDRPEVIVLSGWLIFLASVVLTGVIAAQVAGREVGLRLAAALAFANLLAVGAAGFLTYPVTHNISMLWGLAALALAVVWVKRGAAVALAASGLAMALNGLSDPWAMAAVIVPLGVAGAAVGAADHRSPAGRRALALALVALLAGVAVRTRIFGALLFLRQAGVDVASPAEIAPNAQWGFRALAAMFNVVPLGNPETWPVVAISGAAALAIGLVAVGLALVRLRDADAASRLVVGVCLISCGVVGAAFLLGRWPQGLFVGRYLLNIYFLGGLLLAWALSRRPPLALRVVAGVWIALFVVSGPLSAPDRWLGRTPPRGNGEILALANLLQREGLTYGYGPYWNGYANSMAWLTQDRLVVRPVFFHEGRVGSATGGTSPFWYRRTDEPPGLVERFVVVPNDPECPVVEVCRAVAIAQFGPPARTISYGNGYVLVWRRSLADSIAANGPS